MSLLKRDSTATRGWLGWKARPCGSLWTAADASRLPTRRLIFCLISYIRTGLVSDISPPVDSPLPRPYKRFLLLYYVLQYPSLPTTPPSSSPLFSFFPPHLPHSMNKNFSSLLVPLPTLDQFYSPSSPEALSFQRIECVSLSDLLFIAS